MSATRSTLKVWVVRSDAGTVVFTSPGRAAEYLFEQVETHGIATMWVKLMTQRAYDALEPTPRDDADQETG